MKLNISNAGVSLAFLTFAAQINASKADVELTNSAIKVCAT